MRARAAMMRATVLEGELSEELGLRLEGGLQAATADDGLVRGMTENGGERSLTLRGR